MAGDRGKYWMRRGWMDNPMFRGEPFCRRAAWAWLIEEACWQPRRVNVAGKTIQLKRGQLSHSYRFMARAWGWSDTGRVRRFCNRLKTDTAIDTATDTGQLTITICNYDKYQAPRHVTDTATDTPNDTRPTQDRHRLEEGKKERIEFYSDTVAENDQNGANGSDQNSEKYAQAHFDAFWKAYPRKDKKKEARRIYLRNVIRDGSSPTAIQHGLERYIPIWQERGEPAFIPLPTTWLNNEQWNDEGNDEADRMCDMTDDELAERLAFWRKRNTGTGMGQDALQFLEAEAKRRHK